MEQVMEKKEVDRSKFLPRKRVTLLPIPRNNGIINDPNHKGYFMFPDTKVRFCIPFDLRRGTFVPILNDEERMFFEKELGQSLNFYEKDKSKNFWMKFEVVITKTDDLMTNGITFDLSDVMDNLKVRLLKAQPSVCPNWEDRYEDGEYRFAFRDEGYIEETGSKRADLNITAYKFFAKIQDSRDKMYDFLCIYWMHNNKRKRPSDEATKEQLISSVQEVIDTDIRGFIEIMEDQNYSTQLMVYKAVAEGHITKESTTRDFQMTESKRYLGRSFEDVVANILSPEFQEERLMLEALLEHKTRKTK